MKSALVLFAAIEVGSLVSDEVLEPSVQNEVDHALSRAAELPTNLVSSAVLPVAWTNGLSASAMAIRLVSRQRADGRWVDGTNDVTRAAVETLERL